jgi:hypothetical protein
MDPISRYARAGDTDPATGLRTVPTPSGVVTHQLADGDRLDDLAARYYRESRVWWRICDADPDRLWPLDLVGRGPHRTVHVTLGAADRWPSAVLRLTGTPGIVSAVLAEPSPEEPTRRDSVVAVVVHDRAVLGAADVVALLARLELTPIRYEASSPTGRSVAVPSDVAG